MLSYKCRLYPTITQEDRLNSAIESCRTLYNDFIYESRLAYKEGYKIKFDELQRMIPVMIKQNAPVYSKVAQMVLWQFFNNLKVLSSASKKGKKIGNLRFKPKTRYRSINYNQSGFKLLADNTLKISKIGKVKCIIHREIIGKIKEIIIKKETEKWYAIVVCEDKRRSSCSLIRKKIVGLDVGLNSFVYDSDGHKIKNPQILQQSQKKLRRTQRKLSKKIMNSTNRWKQKLKLARTHQKIKNQRRDFEHKISHYYIKKYDTIFVEDLKIQNMIKNHHLAKSIANASWHSFFQKLEYKAVNAGILFRKVPPHQTSQRCSGCGSIIQKTLATRMHRCNFCGLVVDRDHNAALVIKQKGITTLPVGCREVTPVEKTPLAMMNDHGYVISMNQEANDFNR